MKKKYSSPCVKFTVNVKKDGKQLPIVFNRYDRDAKRRSVIVSDKKIQEQMEASQGFDVYFRLDADYHDPDAVEEVIEKEPEIVEVEEPKPGPEKDTAFEAETLTDAKRYLSGRGIKVYPSMNKKRAIVAAKKEGIELIIKK